MTSKTFDELHRDIRTQGLVGVILLLVTLVMFVYRADTTGGKRYNTVAETARAALETAQSDLQGLIDETGPERNITLLKSRAMFGWDFVPAWMFFIFFLQRVILKSRLGSKRTLWCALFSALFTLLMNRMLNGYIATAERQAVTDAELNRIVFFGQAKWGFLFIDAVLAGLELFYTPLILRVGGVILAISGVVGFGSMGAPSGILASYSVLGIFLAFSGISILLLFCPQVLSAAHVNPSLPPASGNVQDL